MTLPTEAGQRKVVPIATGCLDYFPDAIAAVAAVSFLGNEQHNPGSPLHWDRSKSTDEADALMRHFLERGTRDADGTRHSAKVAWRALALLQKEIEAEREGESALTLRVGAKVRVKGKAALVRRGEQFLGAEATVVEIGPRAWFGVPVYMDLPGHWRSIFWRAEDLEVIG